MRCAAHCLPCSAIPRSPGPGSCTRTGPGRAACFSEVENKLEQHVLALLYLRHLRVGVSCRGRLGKCPLFLARGLHFWRRRRVLRGLHRPGTTRAGVSCLWLFTEPSVFPHPLPQRLSVPVTLGLPSFQTVKYSVIFLFLNEGNCTFSCCF